MTNSTAALNATNLGCSITCKDLQASLRVYRDVLGFTVGEASAEEDKVVAAVVVAGDCRLVLNQDDGKLGWDRIKGQGFYLQINVAAPADVDATAARIKAAGGGPAERAGGSPVGRPHVPVQGSGRVQARRVHPAGELTSGPNR
jgi:catechol 2,3-dioxygenase-like lactoylglutathione lyase family enzyme